MFSSPLHPRLRVFAPHSDEQITKQSHKKECDIHNILSQYQKTGIITHLSGREPAYADLPAAVDYQEAIEMVRDAQESFADLPSAVRERFKNDPFELLAALGDPKNRDELTSLGILQPAPGSGPIPAPTSAAAPAGTTSPTAKPDGA